MDNTQETLDYLLRDCCRGRPEICRPGPNDAPRPDYSVLFICTGNSARSIFAQAILRDLGEGSFVAYSAGTQPRAALNPFAAAILAQQGHDLAALHPRDIAAYRGADAPQFDFAITVCDQAANEECPPWPDQPICAHWGHPDPAQMPGEDPEKSIAFQACYDALKRQITAFAALPFAALDRCAVQRAVDEIGQSHKGASS